MFGDKVRHNQGHPLITLEQINKSPSDRTYYGQRLPQKY